MIAYRHLSLLLFGVWFFYLLSVSCAQEGQPSTDTRAVVTVSEGLVQYLKPGRDWAVAQVGQELDFGDRVRTGEFSRAAIRLPGGSLLRLNELTTIQLEPGRGEAEKPKLNVRKGALYYFGRDQTDTLNIATPVANGAIRGTEVLVEVDDEAGRFVVLEGALEVSNQFTAVSLGGGEAVTADAQGVLRKTPVLDAVAPLQWALYYPAILPATASTGSEAGQAQSLLLNGQVRAALTILQQAPASSEKEALLELIAVVQGKPLATKTSPNGAAHWLARSYTEQALLRLPQALSAARRAIELDPANSHAWGRLAELEFAFGRLEAVALAIERALALDPLHAQSHALRGFSLAGRGEYEAALKDFAEAIRLDGALANGWLGRGLVRIRLGQAHAGYHDLQHAAALEPTRSLLRSYLAKSWIDAGRTALAERELELAVKLDPMDPTPWLYRAIFEQQQRHPLAAVRSLLRSLELNDNRALHRSRFLLDQDLAVRRTNLARLFEQAELREPALTEAGRAVESDFRNPSAHLFLSQAYEAVADPEEIQVREQNVQVNERLLANLLAPIGAGTLATAISAEEYSALFSQPETATQLQTRISSEGRYFFAAAQTGTFRHWEYGLNFRHFQQDVEYGNDDARRTELAAHYRQQVTARTLLLVSLSAKETIRGDTAPRYDPQGRDPGIRQSERQKPSLFAGLQFLHSPEHLTLLAASFLKLEENFTDDFYPNNSYRWNGTAYIGPVNLPNAAAQIKNQLALGQLEALHHWKGDHWQVLAGARGQLGRYDADTERDFLAYSLLATWNQQSVTADYRRFSPYVRIVGQWQPFSLFGGIGYTWLGYPRNTRLAPITDEETRTERFTPSAGLLLQAGPKHTFRLVHGRLLGGYGADEPRRLEPTSTLGFLTAPRYLIPEAIVGSAPAARINVSEFAWDGRWLQDWFTSLRLGFREADSTITHGVYQLDSVDTIAPITGGRIDQVDEHFDYEETFARAALHRLFGTTWSLQLEYRFERASLHSGNELPLLTGRNRLLLLPSVLDPDLQADFHQAGLSVRWQGPQGWFVGGSYRWWRQETYGFSRSGPGRPQSSENLTLLDGRIGWLFPRNRGEIRVDFLNLLDQDYRFTPLNYFREPPRRFTVQVSGRYRF